MLQDRGCTSYRRQRDSGRRSLLRTGVLGALGLSLPDCLRMQAAGAASPIKPRAKRVLLIWPSGGVSHHDTFDPKPDQPAEIRGELGTTETSVPGLRFSDMVPNLAKQAHRFALIRCAHHR